MSSETSHQLAPTLQIPRGIWPFRKSLGRIALETAFAHNVECLRVHAESERLHVETRSEITAARSEITAVGEQVRDLAASLRPLTEMRPDLQQIQRGYLAARVTWMGATRAVVWVGGSIGLIASAVTAWPWIHATLRSLGAHLASIP